MGNKRAAEGGRGGIEKAAGSRNHRGRWEREARKEGLREEEGK